MTKKTERIVIIIARKILLPIFLDFAIFYSLFHIITIIVINPDSPINPTITARILCIIIFLNAIDNNIFTSKKAIVKLFINANKINIKNDLLTLYNYQLFDKWLEITKYPIPVGVKNNNIVFWQIIDDKNK